MDRRYEVAGHWTREYLKPSGIPGEGPIVVPPEWVPGEEAPPPYAGVGTITKKIWAGTVVKFEADHANYLVNKKLAERVDQFGED